MRENHTSFVREAHFRFAASVDTGPVVVSLARMKFLIVRFEPGVKPEDPKVVEAITAALKKS